MSVFTVFELLSHLPGNSRASRGRKFRFFVFCGLKLLRASLKAPALTGYVGDAQPSHRICRTKPRRCNNSIGVVEIDDAQMTTQPQALIYLAARASVWTQVSHGQCQKENSVILGCEGRNLAVKHCSRSRHLQEFQGLWASKPKETKLFGRDIRGFCQDIPELPEKFDKKCLCSIFGP